MSAVMAVVFDFEGPSGLGPADSYEVELTTDGTETEARVQRTCGEGGYSLVSTKAAATSKRSPYDIHVPVIGFALALGRALAELGDGDGETLSIAFRALARTCAELGV